jgi:hypothetical protein
MLRPAGIGVLTKITSGMKPPMRKPSKALVVKKPVAFCRKN